MMSETITEMMSENAVLPKAQEPGAPSAAAGTVASTARRTVKSSDLLAGRIEVLIDHNGAIYSLRATSKGKLILTK